MVENIFSQKDNIKNIENEIMNLSKSVTKKIRGEGRIIFIGAGISSEISKMIIDELWFDFQIPKFKFLSLTGSRNFVDSLDSWKELEEISSASIFELDELQIDKNDLVIALSSSGKTEYVLGALSYANDLGCETAIITDTNNSEKFVKTDHFLNANFSNPIILGLNAAEGASIQKIVIDLIIYNSMEEIGRIWKNELIFIRPISKKLEKYCIEVISRLLNIDYKNSIKIFNENNRSLEVSIITQIKNISKEEALSLLKKYPYDFKKIISY